MPFPWLTHRTMREVAVTEAMRDELRNHRFVPPPEFWRRLCELTARERENNPPKLWR